MDSETWSAWTDPSTMLDLVEGPPERRRGPFGHPNPVIVTDRQLLLWASACVRRIVPHAEDGRAAAAVAIAERFADGGCSYPGFLAAAAALLDDAPDPWPIAEVDYVSECIRRSYGALIEGVDSAYDSMQTPFLTPADDVSRWALAAIREHGGPEALEREKATQCALLRDILGDPFHTTDPRAGRNSPAVSDLAERIYNQHRFDLLPELADALEAAECDDVAILGHCRGSGPHARGCWVLDRIAPRGVPIRWT